MQGKSEQFSDTISLFFDPIKNRSCKEVDINTELCSCDKTIRLKAQNEDFTGLIQKKYIDKINNFLVNVNCSNTRLNLFDVTDANVSFFRF